MKRTALVRKKPLRARPRSTLKPTPDRQRQPALRRTRIKPVSDRRRAENQERRRIMIETFGQYPDCALCAPLAAAGIRTGCNGKADDADEILRRSAGGSILEPCVNGEGNVRPVGRRCHDWVTTHPTKARELGVELRPRPRDP